MSAYLRARLADNAGAARDAANGYAAALAVSPGNEVLAARTLGQAIASGERGLALRAAWALDAAGKATPEAHLLLIGEAFRAKKWNEAAAQISVIEKDEVFAFMGPILRAWLAQGSGRGDPLAALDAASASALGGAYAGEHRALLTIARGKVKEGAIALAPAASDGSIRSQRLRIAAAAALGRKGMKTEALGFLRGESDALAAARARLASGSRLSGEIATPAAGMSELLARIALDLHAQDVPQLALSFARLASFIEPANPEGLLIAAELLSARDMHEAALDALARIPADSPFAATAADRRVAALVEAGRASEALDDARRATERAPRDVDAWTRLGDVLSRVERKEEAAAAYGTALDIARSGSTPDRPLWTLLLLRGGALTEAGRWAEGKAALEEARKLAPDEPVLLNFLGYSQLERRENLPEAERLIAEASRLQPDNAAITDSLGWAYYVRGNVGEAIELLERASAGEPSDPSINEHLGDAYYSAGRRWEARYAWSAALPFAEGKAADRLRAKIDTGLRPDLAAP